MRAKKSEARMKCAIYARVSTEDQHCEMQLTELRAFAGRMGWGEPLEYVERASSTKRRPVFEGLMADARLRKFDAVLVWRIDRIARSMKQFVDTVLTLDGAGVRFLAPAQNIDTDAKNPTSRFLMHILAAVAELERSMIVERVNAGVAEYRRAYDAGTIGKTRHSRSGKDLAVGRPRKIFRRDQVREMRAKGWSWRRIARKLKVPFSTVRRAV